MKTLHGERSTPGVEQIEDVLKEGQVKITKKRACVEKPILEMEVFNLYLP